MLVLCGNEYQRKYFIFYKSSMPDLSTISLSEARFRRRSTHVRNLTEVLSTAKERHLNQFGTAVLIWCGKSVKFDRVCHIIRHWSGR